VSRTGNFGVGSWVERRSRFAPDDTALVVGDAPVTYAQLAERIRRLANGLGELGVAKGDRVAWVGPNHPSFLEALFAAGLVGAALAPVNHRLEPGVIGAVLEDCAPTVLIQHGPFGPSLPVPSSVRHRVAVAGAVDDFVQFEHLLEGAPSSSIEESVSFGDLCLLAYTSGTVGRPKGIMLTHGNVTWNAINMSVTAGIRRDDVTISIAPLFRTGGIGVNVLPVLFVGGTVVMPRDNTPEEILRSTERHRVTVGFGNPDLLDALRQTELWEHADLSNIRFFITGGAPVPEQLIRAYVDRGVQLLQGYGLSEAAPACLLLHPEDSLRKVSSAGKPMLHVDAQIVDESGADVATGEAGELLVRGPNVMAGYWKRPEETERALTSDGWLRTGDAARMDREGYLYIIDRMTDRFMTDGRPVFPSDVEKVLLGLDSVADAAVVGVPDDERGNIGAAFVVLSHGARIGEADLLGLCRQRLAPHQVPRSLTLVESLPRSSVGKLLREELAALATTS
jgi:fatty-acyl-CoA synthase